MKKVKQIERMFPLLEGRRIKIFTGLSHHWATADVTSYSGTYLNLANVEVWNGTKRSSDSIHASVIVKIEFIDKNTTSK